MLFYVIGKHSEALKAQGINLIVVSLPVFAVYFYVLSYFKKHGCSNKQSRVFHHTPGLI